MFTVEEKLVVLKNQLQGNICFERDSRSSRAELAKSKVCYVIHDSVAIKFMYANTTLLSVDKNYDTKTALHCTTILLNFYKVNNMDETSYRLKFRSKELKLNKVFTTVNSGTLHLVYKGNSQVQNVDVKAIIEVIKYQSALSVMHDDTELTDFEMEGADGGVRVHRAVLAAASPVLRRMLSGEWREAASGRVELPGTTRETLQDLKDFVYLGVLPQSGLQPLLLLAAYLMVPELEDRCVQELAHGLTPETTYELIEFAISNKLKKLVNKILERAEWGAMKGADITERDFF